MITSLFHARQLSSALLVMALVAYAHLDADYSGANPRSSGLQRLERDLLRRASGTSKAIAEIAYPLRQ
jgi:hypothetical protein